MNNFTSFEDDDDPKSSRLLSLDAWCLHSGNGGRFSVYDRYMRADLPRMVAALGEMTEQYPKLGFTSHLLDCFMSQDRSERLFMLFVSAPTLSHGKC